VARPPPARPPARGLPPRSRGLGVSAGQPGSTRGGVVLVLILAGLVAAVANGTSIWVPPRTGWVDREALVLRVVGLFAVGMVVAGVAAFVLHRTVFLRRPDPPPLSTTLLRALPFATVTLAMVGLLVIAGTPLTLEPTTQGEASEGAGEGTPLQFRGSWETAVTAGEGAEEEGLALDPDAADHTVVLLLLFGSAFAAALVAGWWLARRFGSRGGNGGRALDPQRAAAHHAVVGTIDAMLADPNPRTAIIGAYARLLEGLAACGTPRRDHEGPVEHLRRVLTVLRVPPGPLRRLIALFEVARFSTHLLTPDHRAQALDALGGVAEHLEGPSASPRSPLPVTSTLGSPS